jgi:hypothetical protein
MNDLCTRFITLSQVLHRRYLYIQLLHIVCRATTQPDYTMIPTYILLLLVVLTVQLPQFPLPQAETEIPTIPSIPSTVGTKPYTRKHTARPTRRYTRFYTTTTVSTLSEDLNAFAQVFSDAIIREEAEYQNHQMTDVAKTSLPAVPYTPDYFSDVATSSSFTASSLQESMDKHVADLKSASQTTSWITLANFASSGTIALMISAGTFGKKKLYCCLFCLLFLLWIWVNTFRYC